MGVVARVKRRYVFVLHPHQRGSSVWTPVSHSLAFSALSIVAVPSGDTGRYLTGDRLLPTATTDLEHTYIGLTMSFSPNEILRSIRPLRWNGWWL